MNNTYMKFAVSVFILSSLVSTSLLAQPRCASVLRSFSAEEISLTFEDLARLTLAADSAKADGSSSRVMNRELKNKVQETLETLSLTRDELRRELAPRIARLQNKSHEEQKENRHQREAEENSFERPKWTFKETIPLPDVRAGIIGLSDVIDGSRKILFLSEFKKYKKPQIEIFDLKTKKISTTGIAPDAYTIDSTGTRLLTYKSELFENPGRYVQTIEVLSLKTLQVEGPPIQLNWSLQKKESLGRYVEALTLSPDGNHIAVRSSRGFFIINRNNPEEILVHSEDSSAFLIRFINENEYIVTSRGQNTIRKFDLRFPGTVKGLTTTTGFKIINKIVPVSENTLAMISSDGISYLNTMTMAETDRVKYDIGHEVAPLSRAKEPYYVGLEGNNPVVKYINNFNGESLAHLEWPSETSPRKIEISIDGKMIVVFGWDSTKDKHSAVIYEQ